MSRYVQIDKSEMDAFMEAIGFHELSVRERTPERMARQGRAVKEAVYESEPIGSDGGRIRIYSSVVGGANGKGREVGQDAIRVQYWIGDQKITGSKRVHRTMNWRKNVLDRVEALRESVATGPLSRIPRDSSGDYMVVRRYKGNEFWGSSNYPRIRETARFAAASVAPIKPETPVQKAMMTKWLMDDSDRQEQVIKLQTMMKLGLITEDDVLEALMGNMAAETSLRAETALSRNEVVVLDAIKNRFFVGRYEAPYEMTSLGIGEKVSMARTHVEAVLRSLVSRGLVVRQKRHVGNGPRKVWAYQITPEGERAVKWIFSAESFKPPASAVANAKRGLKLRKEWGRGGLSPSEAASQGIDSGVTRAKRIASGTVSEHDVRRMSAFNRHRKNYRPDKKESDGGPTAGTIAWLLWGGTTGVNWAKKKSAAMNAEDYEIIDGGVMCRQCRAGNYESCLYGETVDTGGFWLSNCVPDLSRDAETFEAYDVASWNPADEPSEEEAVWEQFYENLSSNDEFVAKLWDLEGQPGDSAESWWNSLTEETGADDSFVSTRQRLENWEAVFERHYQLIKEAAYRYWDSIYGAETESSVVEDGCPVCGDQLSQVSDTVLECNRCEIAWDLITDESGLEYLDSESDEVRDYGVGPTWM